MTLLQYLVKKELIDKKAAASLEYDMKISGKSDQDLLLEKNIIPEEKLFELKSDNLKIPLKMVAPENVPLRVLELIPQDSAKYYKMIPIFQGGKELEIGMVNPEDLRAREALNFLARQGRFSYKIFLITVSTFENFLKQYKTLKKEVRGALEELEAELKVEKNQPSVVKEGGVGRMAEEAPITKVVAAILRYAVEGRASDIHIEPARKELRVRFRMDGALHANLFLPLKIHPAVIARVKILSSLKIDETRVPQDGRFSTTIDEKSIDFRVSTFPTILGEKAALRVLDPTEGVKDFERLGLEKRNFDVVQKAVKRPYGLILSSGPTGSGKTTTLYAILNILNKESVNIITLEDPVEYFIEGINQSQIKPEIGYTFARGLRQILRQDPNIIMVGEIRDEETAALAVNAALTGHIVLSTIHTNDALGVIPRLIDLKVTPFLLPSSLSAAIAQRLVRVLCPHCKEGVSPSQEIKEMIVKEVASLPPQIKKDVKIDEQFKIWQAKGCPKCKNQGYAGRIALFEILEMTDQLSEIILKEPTESKIREEAKRQGMTTMKQDGIIKVLGGVTSIEEVLRVAEKR